MGVTRRQVGLRLQNDMSLTCRSKSAKGIGLSLIVVICLVSYDILDLVIYLYTNNLFNLSVRAMPILMVSTKMLIRNLKSIPPCNSANARDWIVLCSYELYSLPSKQVNYPV